MLDVSGFAGTVDYMEKTNIKRIFNNRFLFGAVGNGGAQVCDCKYAQVTTYHSEE